MARIRGTTAKLTRQRIIDAALDLFAERTFAGTSLRDIAERLALTKSAVYYHFDSKDALLNAILAPLTTGVQDIAATTVKSRAQLDQHDRAAADQLKIAMIRSLVDLQLEHLPLMSSLLFDPSAMRAMAEQHPFVGFDAQFERAFSGSDDPLVRLRHRCAIGAINGGLLMTAKAQRRAETGQAPTQLASLIPGFAEVLVAAALGVLGIEAKPVC